LTGRQPGAPYLPQFAAQSDLASTEPPSTGWVDRRRGRVAPTFLSRNPTEPDLRHFAAIGPPHPGPSACCGSGARPRLRRGRHVARGGSRSGRRARLV